jgi:hypothetical protein
MTLCLTNRRKIFLACYSYGYPLDPYVVLSSSREAAGYDRFWMKPFEDGSLKFIQPVRVAIA